MASTGPRAPIAYHASVSEQTRDNPASKPTGKLFTPFVGAPLLCVDCTYDLRGLNPKGDCPECGTPIMRSVMARPKHGGLPELKRFAVFAASTYSIYLFAFIASGWMFERVPVIGYVLLAVCFLAGLVSVMMLMLSFGLMNRHRSLAAVGFVLLGHAPLLIGCFSFALLARLAG